MNNLDKYLRRSVLLEDVKYKEFFEQAS